MVSLIFSFVLAAGCPSTNRWPFTRSTTDSTRRLRHSRPSSVDKRSIYHGTSGAASDAGATAVTTTTTTTPVKCAERVKASGVASVAVSRCRTSKVPPVTLMTTEAAAWEAACERDGTAWEAACGCDETASAVAYGCDWTASATACPCDETRQPSVACARCAALRPVVATRSEVQ